MRERTKVGLGSLFVLPVVLGMGSLGPAGCANAPPDVQGKTSALTALTPSFDWAMPDRTVVDANNVMQPVDPNPSTWHVSFNACASAPGAAITQYRWTFGDGQTAAGTSCTEVSHDFPSEGVFTVSLTVAAADGSRATTSKDVTVQDFLLIGLGDSYGSGEGSPDVEIPPNLLQDWLDLGVELGQDEMALDHSNQVLAAIDKLLGPVENLLSAISIRDALDCSACSPDGLEEGFCFVSAGCPSPICPAPVCFACKSNCRDAAGNVVSATDDVAAALVEATATAGLESLQQFANDPTGLENALNTLKASTEATLQTLGDTIKALQGQRDIIPNLAAVVWDDKQCHRSSFSAQARTALAMEAADPRTSVTFVPLACSGAKTTDLFMDGYPGIDTSAGGLLTAQLRAATQLVGTREVDAVMLSIGGNDANFAPIILAGISQEPTDDPASPIFTRLDAALLGVPEFCTLTYFFVDHCLTYFDSAINFGLGPSGLELFQQGIAILPKAYATLTPHIQSTFPDVVRDPRRVLATQYPDATHDEAGNFCGPRLDRLPDIADIPGWSTPEWTWAGQTVVPQINGVLQASTAANGWTLVDGIFAGFARHGVCADDNWINRIQQSFDRQGDQYGSVHPSRAGYTEIATHLISALQPQLFSGPNGTPRRPHVPPVADAGPPISVNEGSSFRIVNNSLDPSRTGGLTFEWSLVINPPGTASLSQATAQVPTLHAFDDGAGVVTVKVTSEIGTTSASTPVVVVNVAPTVNAGKDRETTEGAPITLAVSFADPGLSDTHTAHVTWGDGASSDVAVTPHGRLVSVTHRYLNDGNFTAQVAVRDDDGGVGTATVRVQVKNLPPIVGHITGPSYPTPVGAPITVSASFSDAGVLDRHTGTVNWGDGTIAAATIVENGGHGTVSATHSYRHPGAHEVTLIVTDDAGASGEATAHLVTTGPPAHG